MDAGGDRGSVPPLRRRQSEPRSELHYVNPFTLLVAVVLSAQATDAGVNKATPALFKLADTPEKMVKLGEAKVRDLIKTIGLFRTKAKNVVALSQMLVERTAARSRTIARRSKRCPASAARPPTWCSMSPSASRPSRSTPTFPRRQPHRPRRRQDAARSGNETDGSRAEALSAARPSLAHPARPLYLHRAPSAVRDLHHRRSLQMAGQDSCASGRRGKPLRIGLAHANSLSPKGRGLGRGGSNASDRSQSVQPGGDSLRHSALRTAAHNGP